MGERTNFINENNPCFPIPFSESRYEFSILSFKDSKRNISAYYLDFQTHKCGENVNERFMFPNFSFR